MASLGLPHILRARDQSNARLGKSKQNTSVILIWLDGGPSHLDLYDLKPEAPAEIRGIWRPIQTRVPGFDISEMFPKQAKLTDKFSIVRSLHHGTGDHFAGGHRMLTTKDMGVSGNDRTQKFPGLGAIVSREVGPRRQGMPAFVGVPNAMTIGIKPGYLSGHMLGAHHNPFEVGGDPNSPKFAVQNLNLAKGLSLERMEDRRNLVRHLDRAVRGLEQDGTAQTMDKYSQEALEFVTGPQARQAFDINAEDAKLRDSYGRNNWGQSTLLARRLVEAGSTFVTAHFGGWDSHWNMQSRMEKALPMVDSAVSALLEDLDQRGLLETTLVVMCGEFGRTPRMNDGGNGGPPLSKGTPGRDHWGNAMFCLLGGGGVKGGQVVGSTDRQGGAPDSHPYTPSNLHATIYQILGIDPHLQLLDPAGRPVSVLDDPSPIRELL